MAGVRWTTVRKVGTVVHEVLEELGLTGYAKTSGKRGLHVYVRLKPRWTYEQVRRCALALAREVERRAPRIATTKWWKEERHGVFIDYNQNARDRTIAGAYSVRPTPEATVSAPIEWSELADCDPRDFTLATMPERFRAKGDPHGRMDAHRHSLSRLIDLADRQESEGRQEAPWPPTRPPEALVRRL